VLEHLVPAEAARVIANLKAFTRQGFLITVPAREAFDANHVRCQDCSRKYHIWGHCQRFKSFDDVDAMVGQTSIKRRLICTGGVRVSERLAVWQKRLGFAPWGTSYLCPHCGAKLQPPPSPPFINRMANKGLAALQRLGSPLRRPRGWFACLYDA
jgi:DNA-directed RNA polymerase subunit RPC12/RpoP